MQGGDARRGQGTEPCTQANRANEPKTPHELPPAEPASPPSTAVALFIGLSAACAFAGLASINLSAQGLFYDEVHQAPAAFAWLGKKAPFFALALVRKIPLMTMTYSGAIKPVLYGLYLRCTGASFTVESWRWVGIMLVTVTFPLFSLLARKRISAVGLAIFFAPASDRLNSGAGNAP